MVSKVALIYKETQVEEAAAQDDKTCRKNEQGNSITLNVNGKWFI